MTHRIPVYRPVYIPDIDADYPGLYDIDCAECGANNGSVRLAYTAGRLIGATVRLDRRLLLRPTAHVATGLPRFGAVRTLKGKQARGLRRSTNSMFRRAEEAPVLSTYTDAPNRLWLYCVECNAGHLVHPMAHVLPSD